MCLSHLPNSSYVNSWAHWTNQTVSFLFIWMLFNSSQVLYNPRWSLAWLCRNINTHCCVMGKTCAARISSLYLISQLSLSLLQPQEVTCIHVRYSPKAYWGFNSWCYIPNIKALGLVVSDKKIFSCFPIISLCNTCDPRVGPFLAPGA